MYERSEQKRFTSHRHCGPLHDNDAMRDIEHRETWRVFEIEVRSRKMMEEEERWKRTRS